MYVEYQRMYVGGINLCRRHQSHVTVQLKPPQMSFLQRA